MWRSTLEQSAMTGNRLPPGRYGLPFVGETFDFLSDFNFQRKRSEKYGSIVRTHLFGRPTAIMMGAEANRFIFSTGMEHLSWREGWPQTYRVLFGESLFVQDGEAHRKKRKLLMPAFHREALQEYVAKMESITRSYMRRWEQLQTFAWYDENKNYMFDIVSTLLLGCEPGEQTQRLSQLFATLATGFVALPVRLPGTRFSRALHAREELLKHIETAVVTRQKNPTHDALSLLIQSHDEDGNSLTLSELNEQALLLLFAGHETTTSMLTSFCRALAQHPHVMEKLRIEQNALSGAITFESLRSMTYLDQVFKEVERMYAPVSGGFRGVIKSFEFNGYTVPKGWLVLYHVPHTHYDETIFPNPQQFDPDRFAPPRSEGSSPYTLIGYGAGPRVCLGIQFAQLALKICAVHLLRAYTWQLEPDQNLDPVYLPTLHPTDGLRVRFTRC
jgi:cytochrome P450